MIKHEMLTLGRFVFQTDKVAYSKINTSRAFSWSETRPMGMVSRSTFEGPEPKKISLNGVISTQCTGGRPLKDLYEMAQKGRAYIMKDSRGFHLGKWKIENISEDGEKMIKEGYPVVVSFKIDLSEYYG